MDRAGDIAIGYSVAGPSTFPGIRYAGRLAGDPAGTLAQGEVTLVDGTGAQERRRRATGATLDDVGGFPAPTTARSGTGRIYTQTGDMAWHTRIGSFRFPSCSAIGRGD